MTVSVPTPQNEQDPGQRDAERLKKHYSIAFLLKLLAVVLFLFLLLCLGLYIAAGTSRGTQFLLEKVVSETGVKLQYGEGNLRDGLLVTDVALSAGKDIEVHFINAYVKLGWRAIFIKEVHLREADIERIEIINHKPATGEPFDYKTLKLPINLRFDKAHIGSIEYDQVGKDPILVTDVAATDLSWMGTKVAVDQGNFQYNELVKIADLSGFVQLEDNYPLDLAATVTVFSLEKVYVAPIDIQATGSLKRTYGLLRSRYNDREVTGEFAIQGLDDNAPFDAKLQWEELTLPYAEAQEITLKQGLLVASGVLSDIELRFSSQLLANDIPSGLYQGRASVVEQKMLVERLSAHTPEGDLLLKGVLDWQDSDTNGVVAKVMGYGNDYDVRALLPEDVAPYAPKTLDGQLAVVMRTKNADGLLQIQADLKQQDGEHVNATIVQGVTPENPRFQAPWLIDAHWQNVRRQDVPQVGNIDSPSGSANVKLRDNRLWVTANATINELNAAPQGNYRLKLAKVNNRINITNLGYQGGMGDLAGSGSILLADANKPLTWQIKAKTGKLLPQVLKADLPVTQLVGDIDAFGTLTEIQKTLNGKTVTGQRHVFTVNDTDLTATLTTPVQRNGKTEKRQVAVSGKGAGSAELIAGELQAFTAKFAGQLDTQGLPKGQLVVDAAGTPNAITLNTLQHQGEAGSIRASGSVNLQEGAQWQLTADAQAFNAGFFTPQTDAKVSGHLVTSGKWLNAKNATTASSTPNQNSQNRLGDLQNFALAFDGRIDTPKLPKGALVIDASGTSNTVAIHKFSHVGIAGNLAATGTVRLQDGVQWQLNADAKQFDVGFFTTQSDAKVSGHLLTSGHWQDPSPHNPQTPSSNTANNTGNNTGDNTAATASYASQLAGLKAFAVMFDGSIDTPKLPQGKLNIDASGNAHAIEVRKFSHIGEAGQLSARGSVDISHGIAWDVDAVMNQFNLGYFVKNVPSTLTGRLASTGMWGGDEQRIVVSKMALRGQLKGKPVQASGNLKATLHLPKDMNAYINALKAADSQAQVSQFKAVVTNLTADNLLLQWADNRLVANGNGERLQTQVSIHNLQQLADNWSGSVAGGIILVQPQTQALPTLYVDLTGAHIRLPSFALSKGTLKGKIVDLGKNPSKLALVAEGLEAAGTQFNDVTAVFNGTEQAHRATLRAKALSANTAVAFKASVQGGLEQQQRRWRGVLANAEVATKYVALQQSQPAQIVVSFAGATSQVQVAAHCWAATDQAGKLCLKDNVSASSEQGQVNLAIQNIDTTLLAPFMPKDLSWQAKVNGRALIGWHKGQNPNIDAVLYSDNGKIGMTQEGSTDAITLPYKRVSLIAKSFAEGLKVRTDINSGHGARGYADIVIDPYQAAKPISGALVLNEFNLAILKPFFPGMRRLEGGITMAGGVGGTLTSPVFYGDVNLKDANIAILDLPINLSNINAKAKIRGQSASLDGTFMSGEGKGSLTGTVDWQQELQAKIRIQGERLVVAQPPLLFAEVNPDFNIIIKPSQQYVNIVGAVSVPTATIRPPEANEKVITKSDDVVVLDRRLIGNIDDVLAVSKPWSINADVGIDLGDDVYFRGFGAVLPLAGAIHVTQSGQGVMKATGVVQVSRRSNIDAFGQNLELNYAQVRFNGDVLNPQLSIEAVKEIEGQTVGLRVNNNVANPNIVVFNDAGLTQQQAMNALVTGRISGRGATQISEQGFKSEVTNTLAAAGLSLGLSSTRSLTNSIGKAFGFQSLTLDASGKGSSTNLNVTGYITPDLYIRYGVGVFDAQNSLALRYQLTRRVYIEATSAAENAVDVVYSFQF